MSEAELVATLNDFYPQLRVTKQTMDVIHWIKNAPLPPLAKPVYKLLFHSALATMPADFRKLIGMKGYPLWMLRPLTTNLLRLMRFAIGPESPIEDAARARLVRAGVIQNSIQ
jgi:hypothetical protein